MVANTRIGTPQRASVASTRPTGPKVTGLARQRVPGSGVGRGILAAGG